jgi:hypothetical protein
MKKRTSCVHYWHHPYVIWSGRNGREDEVGVARYCSKCGKKQMAYANKWGNIPAGHDARGVCERQRRDA